MTKQELLLQVLQQATEPLTLREIMHRMGAEAPTTEAAARTLVSRLRTALKGHELALVKGQRYVLIQQRSLPLPENVGA